MTRQSIDDPEIFRVARKIESSDAQIAYLRQVCGEDQVRIDRLVALLEADGKQSDFLEVPPSGVIFDCAKTHDPSFEQPGAVVGRYKLLQKIGEGGFGIVYMSEQLEPVRRKVALKVSSPMVKPDSGLMA